MVFGGSLPNHTLAEPFKLVGKALHMILSETPWMCMVVLKVAMWSQGSLISSYESKVGILNLEGRGWLVMDTIKGESVLWIRSSTWFALFKESFISFMTLFIWSISLSKCGTLRVTIPLEWSPTSAPFSTISFSEFCLCSSPQCYRQCLLTSLVNSWFCWVKSTFEAAMDYNCCWTVNGGAGAWFGRLEAFPFSWCSGLVAIDLVQTM